VISSFRLVSYGAVPLGALVGGLLARRFGLPAPFLVAGLAVPVMALLTLPFVNTRTVEQALAELEEGPVSPASDATE
jgi:predicted MFS family arabinose efflux permease